MDALPPEPAWIKKVQEMAARSVELTDFMNEPDVARNSVLVVK